MDIESELSMPRHHLSVKQRHDWASILIANTRDVNRTICQLIKRICSNDFILCQKPHNYKMKQTKGYKSGQ